MNIKNNCKLTIIMFSVVAIITFNKKNQAQLIEKDRDVLSNICVPIKNTK